ncbi:MAG: prolipoprotein diacylglyceryl transferase [Bacteroidia bacterium]
MYPRISDLFNDLLGTDFLLPFQTFGVFLALAFLSAYLVIRFEYRRLTGIGVFPSHEVDVKKGGEIKFFEVIISAVLYAIMGYKLGLMFEDYTGFSEDPQSAILSTEGSIPGLLIGALIGGGWRFWDYRKKKGEEVRFEKEMHSMPEELPNIMVIAFVAGLLGAKVFHNLENLDAFMADPWGQLFSFSGLTFYGGLIVGTVFMVRYIHKKGYKLLPFLDVTSMSVILAYGVGRIGCQMSGDGDWGEINNAVKPDWLSWAPDWFWSYDYPNNVLQRCNPDSSRYEHLNNCNWEELGRLAEPVFPTPIYETLMALAIFGFLWFIRKKLPYWGQLLGLFLFLNGIERFLIEQIRVNNKLDFLGMQVTQAEVIASCMMLAGIAVVALATFVWKQKARHTPLKE